MIGAVRAASDLGLSVTLIQDAVLSFDLTYTPYNAELLWKSTLALLAADFAALDRLASVLEKNK